MVSTVISYNSQPSPSRPMSEETTEGGVSGSERKVSGRLRTRRRSVTLPMMRRSSRPSRAV